MVIIRIEFWKDSNQKRKKIVVIVPNAMMLLRLPNLT